MLQPEIGRTSNRYPCWPWQRAGWSLKQGKRVEQVSRWGQRRGLGGPPLAGAVCRHVQDPAFAPCISEVGVGWCPFYILLYILCPSGQRYSCSWPLQFSVFCCWRRGLSRCKHCSRVPGPQSQPDSWTLGGCTLSRVKGAPYGEDHVARNCRKPLGSDGGLQLMAFKELGPQSCNHREMNCATNLKGVGTVFPKSLSLWVKTQPGQTPTVAR